MPDITKIMKKHKITNVICNRKQIWASKTRFVTSVAVQSSPMYSDVI